jgi:alpha-L-fucosidase
MHPNHRSSSRVSHTWLKVSAVVLWIWILTPGGINAQTVPQFQIRIMPLGDSITEGCCEGGAPPIGDPRNGGYRDELLDGLRNAGINANFVGTLRSLPAHGFDADPDFDADHEGHPGYRADQIADNVYGWLVKTRPDIVLLHIGTNDVEANRYGDGPLERFWRDARVRTDVADVQRILQEIDRYSRDVRVILARITNRSCANRIGEDLENCREHQTTTTLFNREVALMAETRIAFGDKIILVDMENGAGLDYSATGDMFPGLDKPDGVHLLESGFSKMAQVWLSVARPECEALLVKMKAEHDERMAWWREAQFGMFIHWGLYAIPAGEWEGTQYPLPSCLSKDGKGKREEPVDGRCPSYKDENVPPSCLFNGEEPVDGKCPPTTSEWIMSDAKVSAAEYEQKLVGKFNPSQFDPDAWVSLAKAAGMKYIVFTAKHHDGFCMWDTAQKADQEPYSIMRTPFKRDVLKELSKAAIRHGIKFGVYYSITDWHHPAFQEDSTTYDKEKSKEYMKKQLEELSTYNPSIIWLDVVPTWWTAEDGNDLFRYIQELGPGIIIDDRGGKRDPDLPNLAPGVVDTSVPHDHLTFEQERKLPSVELLKSLPGEDWEQCMTMNRNWGFNKFDNQWKSAETLHGYLSDITSKGGNFLLNVGPDADGVIPQASAVRLLELGRLRAMNRSSPIDPRVYYVGAYPGLIYEVAWFKEPGVSDAIAKWHTSDLLARAWRESGDLAPAPRDPQALTGFAVGANLSPRVYYLGVERLPGHALHIWELAWFNDTWHATDLFDRVEQESGQNPAPPAAGGRMLTGFGVGMDLDPRVYYLGADKQIHELAWFKDDPQGPGALGKWHYRPVGQEAGAVPAAAGSALAGFGVGTDLDPRVYYLGADNQVHELAWFNDTPQGPSALGRWHYRAVGQEVQAPKADVGSALAGFGVGTDLDPRVYYLGADDKHVHELAWTRGPNDPANAWHTRDVHDSVVPWTPTDADGSALTGFGARANLDPRVYYVSKDSERDGYYPNGLVWLNGRWQFREGAKELRLDPALPPVPVTSLASPDSKLTGFAVGYHEPRVYFENSKGDVNELRVVNTVEIDDDMKVLGLINPDYSKWTVSENIQGEAPKAHPHSALTSFGVGGEGLKDGNTYEVVNDLVTFEVIPDKPEPAPAACPADYEGSFRFQALLTNVSSQSLGAVGVEIESLTGGNSLLTDYDTGLAGPGDLVDVVPLKDEYVDRILVRNEEIKVPFTVCLRSKNKFAFYVNVWATTK